MSKEKLLISAKELHQVTEGASKEFSENIDLLVSEMNKYMLGRTDISELVGENNIEMMKDNHANHARFMESVFTNYDPEVLVDTVLWVFRAYRARNFNSTYWAAQLNAWITIHKKHLSEKCFNEILPYYKWMQVHIPTFNALAEQDIEAPLSSH
jgi:hypothetical protein